MALGYKIITNDINTFTKITEVISELPLEVSEQIISAEKTLHGLECVLKFSDAHIPNINLPKQTRQITNFDNYIGAYCEINDTDFFFKIIPKEKQKINYSLV